MRGFLRGVVVVAVGAVGLGLGMAGAGMFLPAQIELTTKTMVEASPEELFPLLSTSDGLQRWWLEVAETEGYPGFAVDHTNGPTQGAGCEVQFTVTASSLLLETWTLMSQRPPTRVEYAIDFRAFEVDRTITLSGQPQGTQVTWVEKAELSNPLLRWMPVIMGKDPVEQRIREAIAGLDRAATR
ncbi:MAG: SRPBCC family protein [Myxococcales bacterium]|nr:SRPBCC family protein [Myxococcales bacterium]